MRKEIISFDISSWLSEACKHSNRLFSSMEIIVPVDLEDPVDQLCRKVVAMSHAQPWQIKPESIACFMVTMPLSYELTLAGLDCLCSTIRNALVALRSCSGLKQMMNAGICISRSYLKRTVPGALIALKPWGENKFTTMVIRLSNK